MEPKQTFNCSITNCPRCKEITHECEINRNPLDCSHYQYKMKGKKNDQAGSNFENSSC